MDVKHLQALIGVADFGGFSAAAEVLGTVQSNVSTHVARLERELDAVLIDRATGRLTDVGEVVVVRARRLVSELDAIVADVSAMRDQIRGRIRLGVIGTAGRWLVPLIFEAVQSRYPLVHLTITDGTNTLLEPQILNGQLDLAIVTMPVASDELRTTPLFQEELVLVAPSKGETAKLFREASLPWSKLAQIPLILPAPGTSLRQEIDSAAAKGGVALTPIMELDGVRMIASMVFDGHGAAILPATAVPKTLRDTYSMVAIEGLPPRLVSVALRSRGFPGAPIRALVDLLHEIVGNSTNRPSGLVEAQPQRR
jgi:DNA-binding transcriptional LysR family regulator